MKKITLVSTWTKETDLLWFRRTTYIVQIKLMSFNHRTKFCEILCETSSRREYYIFFGPPCGIIFSENSEKNF